MGSTTLTWQADLGHPKCSRSPTTQWSSSLEQKTLFDTETTTEPFSPSLLNGHRKQRDEDEDGAPRYRGLPADRVMDWDSISHRLRGLPDRRIEAMDNAGLPVHTPFKTYPLSTPSVGSARTS